jgi:hypothetical protein
MSNNREGFIKIFIYDNTNAADLNATHSTDFECVAF